MHWGYWASTLAYLLSINKRTAFVLPTEVYVLLSVTTTEHRTHS